MVFLYVYTSVDVMLIPDINLPTGIISLALLYFFLKLNPTAKYSFKELQTTFDWPGL